MTCEHPGPQFVQRRIRLGQYPMPDRVMIGGQLLANMTVLGAAAVSPVRRHLIMALYMYDMLTRNSVAASRTDIPPSTAAKIRSRTSCEYA
jgi:hypothetical protein